MSPATRTASGRWSRTIRTSSSSTAAWSSRSERPWKTRPRCQSAVWSRRKANDLEGQGSREERSLPWRGLRARARLARSEEAVQQAPAPGVEPPEVVDPELDAVAVRDQQRPRPQPADVLLGAQRQARLSPVGHHPPFAGRDEGRDRQDPLDPGHDVALGERRGEHLARGGIERFGSVDPVDLAPLAPDQGNARVARA